ncbi:MAG: hypothetical protein IRY85_16625, partial [Micromonosporaceae bacterium]|nr:hypothetical protein [Micromonosporaceae bacterium]
MRQDHLADLLKSLATEVDRMPHREFSAPAWAQAGRVRRRRFVAGAAVATVLVALPVVLLIGRPEKTDPPANPEPTYSTTPLRGRAAHTATLLA